MNTRLQEARVTLEAAEQTVLQVGRHLASLCSQDGRLSRSLLDEYQPEAFDYARSLAEVAAARAALDYAQKLEKPYESELAVVYTAQACRAILGRTLFHEQRPDELPLQAHLSWIRTTLNTSNLKRIGELLLNKDQGWTGDYGLSEGHEEMRDLFGRVADEQVAPLAEHIHRHDDIIPEHLLEAYAEIGVFGISIPEEYGGFMQDNLSMCLATEELSRGSLGIGGSVITRPEICAKALLKGGSEEQKQEWLPRLASGEAFVSVAVTEPNAGSDVAGLRFGARKVEGGYVLNGEKTWCTFAGRANVFCLLARTGTIEEKHRGLTLFLVEKPAKITTDDHHHFAYEQPEGGRVEGRAIPTIGYRGMHSFSVSFEDYFVPEANRVGDEGQGFILQMEGFAGGRIQTAARAVGLMEAAYREAIAYARDRKVFNQSLAEYSMSKAKLVQMAATLMACRQLSYQVAFLMDEGKGGMEASLVKLLSCREAEWLTREAMQLHGGMGYSEEYAVSRHWVDARVLSIFEGAEEVLALYVVARQSLRALVP